MNNDHHSFLEEDDKTFSYENCLDRNYDIKEKKIKKITFAVGRYGKHTHTITFVEKFTEEEAIEHVEAFLSKPLTDDYFNLLGDDFFASDIERARKNCRIRGDCLGDAFFLEIIDKLEEEGSYEIVTGS